MNSLQEMFGLPSYQLHHDALKNVFNAKMQEGQSVRELVLDMINQFNIAEANGGIVCEHNQVAFILHSLPTSYMSFRTNASMNKIQFNLTTLLSELQIYEVVLKSKSKNVVKGEANVAHSKKKFLKGSSSLTD
ncbi:MAG: hypothetical protein Q8754_02750 [Sweet potato little leaf phytoplasma]|nr:hypothetical protein [Sweet potato little leaf phytoplasma]